MAGRTEDVTRASGNLTDKNFILKRIVYDDHNEVELEAMQVAVLMDLRDQLKLINAQLAIIVKQTKRPPRLALTITPNGKVEK